MVGDPAFLFTLEALIAEVDGQKPDPLDIQVLIRSLPMMDTNYIMKYAKKLVDIFGIESKMTFDCKECGMSYDTPFRTTSEFFGPSVDF